MATVISKEKVTKRQAAVKRAKEKARARAKKAVASSRQVPVTDEDMEAIYSGPAVFVNKTFLTGLGVNTRLTFVEVGAGRARFRAAVSMANEHLIELHQLLSRTLAIHLKTIEIPEPNKDGE